MLEAGFIDSAVRAFQPYHRTERYSPTLKVDFRKLELRSLLTYVKAHSIPVRPDSTRDELAVAVGRHFQDMTVEHESGVLGALLRKSASDYAQRKTALGKAARNGTDSTDGYSGGTSDEAALSSNDTDFLELDGSMKRQQQPGSGAKRGLGKGWRAGTGGTNTRKTTTRSAAKREEPDGRTTRRTSAQLVAGRSSRVRAGEQVACLTDDGQGAGQGWILARIEKYEADDDMYSCVDEDDKDATYIVPAQHVIRLKDETKGLERGDDVLAVYPETTAFYSAVVDKVLRGSNAEGNAVGGHEIIVLFKDDQDETGTTPARRLSVRYVITIPTPAQPSATPTKAAATSAGAVKRAAQTTPVTDDSEAPVPVHHQRDANARRPKRVKR